MKKPNPTAIRDTRPLSADRPEDPLSACSVCGKPAETYDCYRESDERDRPIAGDTALVFIGRGDDHKRCHELLQKHPRLYHDERGEPGRLPMVCSPCQLRKGLSCTHPDLKANGGTGLRLRMHPWAGAHVRGSGGCSRPFDVFVGCVGRVPQ